MHFRLIKDIKNFAPSESQFESINNVFEEMNRYSLDSNKDMEEDISRFNKDIKELKESMNGNSSEDIQMKLVEDANKIILVYNKLANKLNPNKKRIEDIGNAHANTKLAKNYFWKNDRMTMSMKFQFIIN